MSRRTPRLEDLWTDVDGLRVYARVSLDLVPAGAPAVVLVHGVGVASRYFVPTAERLAPFHRVYAPDLPGFGRSDKPPEVLDIRGLAAALGAWMGAAGLERAVLLGNSVGCQIVADLAMREPARVERVVLAGPTMDPAARTWRQEIGRWLRNSRHERLSQAPISLRDYRRCGVRRFVRTFGYALEDRIEDKLPHVRVPALVVRGGLDTIVPQRWAEEVTRLLPRGRLVVIPGAAHTVNYNAPLELVRVVQPFLDEDGQRRVRRVGA